VAKKSLEQQLETVINQAAHDKVKNKGLTALTLFHLDGLRKKEEVHSMPLAGISSPSEIADIIFNRVETHASGSDDKMKYELAFFYDSDKPQRPYTFFYVSDEAYGPQGVEEATAKALVKNVQGNANKAMEIAFQQTNAVNEALVSGVTSLMDATTRQLKIVTERLEATTDERDVAIRLLIQEQAVKESKAHEFRMAEMDKLSSNEFKRQAMVAAPALINSITQAMTKKSVFPEATGDSALLKMIFAAIEKMDPQFVMSFFGQLPEMTQATVIARGEQLRAEEKERVAAERKALELASGLIRDPETPVKEMGK